MKKHLTNPTPLRSAIMRAIKSRDTGPERVVRHALQAIAPGYRLQRRDLPGKPDVAFVSRKLAIFVHGCFWHGHACAQNRRSPKTNAAFWAAKIARNRARDAAALAALRAMGWRALVLWECELGDAGFKGRLRGFLGPGARFRRYVRAPSPVLHGGGRGGGLCGAQTLLK